MSNVAGNGGCGMIRDEATIERTPYVVASEQVETHSPGSTPWHLWRADPDGVLLEASLPTIAYLGADAATIQKTWASAIHPKDLPDLLIRWNQSRTSGAPFYCEYRWRKWDGTYRWFRFFGVARLGTTGEITGWDGSADEIAKRQETEGQHLTELQSRRLIDTLPIMVWTAQPSGEPSYINRRLMEYVGLTLAELDGEALRLHTAIESSVHPEDASAVRTALTSAFGSGKPFAMRYRQRRNDGVYRWTDGRAVPHRDTKGTILQWYGVSLDIDDEMRAAAAVRQAQDRLGTATQAARISELAASVAHEINQPLTAILASADALASWLSKQPPNIDRAMRLANNISRDAAAASGTINSIRALFRGITGVGQSLDINIVVKEFTDAMRDELNGGGIDVRLSLATHLPPAIADELQLQQVLNNLVRNAVEAMTALEGSQRQIEVCTRFERNEVRVDVVDRGHGIADPDRVFDPFHSTKKDGMGMGLAICRSIIEAYSGRLWVDATGPEGTRMSFALPAVQSS